MNLRRLDERHTAGWGLSVGLALLGFLAGAAPAGAATVQMLLTNGPAANRLNVAILSEGYTSSQLGQFLVDATNALNVLLAKAPFSEYRDYINGYAISVASTQSGSDHPTSGVYRSTYFNSSYDSYSDLYITVPPDEFDSNASHGQGKIDALVQQLVPNCGLSVLLVNDLVPGGSDGFDHTAIFSNGHVDFLPHETGHVLAGLGDEYSLEYPGFPDTEEPNTTRETRRDFIKWKAWIAADTPVPTPATYGNVVGLFEGAHYHATGWYRPKMDCAMRSPYSEFCDVCSEALVLAIYGQVRPIDAFAPVATNLAVYAPDPVGFSLTLPQPRTHNLTVQWFTNGVTVPGAGGGSFSLSSAELKLGTNTVRALVSDLTPLVRTDPSNLLSQSLSWTVNVKPRPTLAASLAGNNLILTGSGGTPGGTAYVVRAWDATLPLAGWTAVRTNVFDASGSFRLTNALAPGVPAAFYRLRLP